MYAEAMELGRLHRSRGVVVALVDHQHDRYVAFAQFPGELGLDRRRAGESVNDEQDQVRRMHRLERLTLDLAEDLVLRLPLQPAGVDDDEAAASPFGLVPMPVTGQPREAADDRLTATDNPVEQRRLADVRASDDGDLCPVWHGKTAPNLGMERSCRPPFPGACRLVATGSPDPGRGEFTIASESSRVCYPRSRFAHLPPELRT